MALDKSFSNTGADRKDKKREITRFTELNENDKNTIFNLIFIDKQKQAYV